MSKSAKKKISAKSAARLGRGPGQAKPLISRSAAPLLASAQPARRILAARVNAILKGRGLNQVSAAARLGMPQPKVSAIRNYKLTGISLERLVDALVALDQRVMITVVSPKTGMRPGIEVIS